MDLIPSFAVDHTKIKPGIYLSRKDGFVGCHNNVCACTYDIRMTCPNKQPAIAPAAMHTIEHLVATYLRNDEFWKDQLIYWGPMGCLTGFYMITKGEYSPQFIRGSLIAAMKFIINYEGQVPGTDVTQCGNYLMHDLPMAKWEAQQYLDRLEDDFNCEYPTIERKQTKEGDQFYDS